MAKVSTYLNYDGTCEEAFAFYREVFGGEYSSPIMRIGDFPAPPGAPALTDDESRRIMHVALAIVGGHEIMGADILPSRGHVLTRGNTMSINLELDDEDTLRDTFERLAEGAGDSYGPTAEVWGQLFATCEDRFGIRWMMVAPLSEGTGLA